MVEKKTLRRRLTPAAKSGEDRAHSQRAKPNEPEADIAAMLANELLNSMRSGSHAPPSTPSDVLFDREFNGYRVILMRGASSGESAATLSPREQEIARMVAKGYPNKTIAAVLEISTWTVGTHLRRMFAKLGVNSRAALVAQFIHLRDEE
jgi:DNA-binding CsgD family transcriptional regulator